jgi:conjugative relaxase-like TrwC/TraI family protein
VHALVREPVVTARVTTLKGHDAGRYYVEGPGSYYIDGDEPPGRWLGRGAEALGLSGDVDDDDFLALMDGRDPAGRLLGTSHHDRTVRAFDVTFSAPKSVSVLWAVGDVDTRRHVLEAHDAAVEAVLQWVEDRAHCRYRVDGEIWTVDARGIVAAAFRQHTSRAHDPQLHTHLVIANRVLAPDVRWLALDARTLKCDQRTISALYAAGLRAELTARLGLRWATVEHGQAEIADAPEDVIDLFSQRTGQMQQRLDEKLERFADDLGRPPTSRERWQLEREAVIDSRPSKTSSDAASLHDHWADQLEELGHNADRYLADITHRTKPIEPDDTTDRLSVVQALSTLRDTQSVWRPAEITREIAAAMATQIGSSAADMVARAEALASHVEDTLVVDVSRPAPPGVPLRRDGRPVTEGALDRLLTTRAILDEEEHVLDAAQRWSDQGGADAHDLPEAEDLTAVQHHAAAAVAGERRLVLVVGPAGTGKTTAMRPAVAHLHARGRACFGVAPSAAAAEVLAVDTGIDADTLDKLLIEHRLERPPQARFDLPAGTTVIVDEAAMVATPRLAELIDLAALRGWRLALIGDPMQFSAVGRSGMFGHLIDTHGAVELDRVHRFTASWERDASLRLRRGDTDVVDLYERHDRLHGGTGRQMAKATVAAWRRATEAGESAAMMAPTREGAAVLNELAQYTRITSGEIDLRSPSVKVGTSRAHPGDLVATRRNDRTLATDQRRMVKNRDHWTVETAHHDGRLTVAGRTGRVTLPADYVASHVELAYAETSHATQGRTVDRSFLFLDGQTDTRGIYVPLSRGRTTNEAFVVLHDERTAAEVVADAVARTWIDQPATALRLDRLEEPADSGRGGRRPGAHTGRAIRPVLLPEAELRTLVKQAARHQAVADKLDREVAAHDRALSDLARRRQQLTRSIETEKIRLASATRTLDDHDRPFRRRHHRFEIAQAKHNVSDLPDSIQQSEQELAELPGVIEAERASKRLTVQKATTGPDRLRAERVQIALGDDARVRGEQATTGPDQRLLDHLGPVPKNPAARDLWIDAAGRVAQHHALWGVPAGSALVGPMPPLGNDEYPVTFYAANRASHDLDRAVGRRAIEREVPGLSL